MADVRDLLKKVKRPPRPFADAPALFDSGSKAKRSLKNRIRGLERLLKKVRPACTRAALARERVAVTRDAQRAADNECL